MSDSSNTSGTRFSGPDGVAQNSEAPILGQAMRVFLPPKNS